MDTSNEALSELIQSLKSVDAELKSRILDVLPKLTADQKKQLAEHLNHIAETEMVVFERHLKLIQMVEGDHQAEQMKLFWDRMEPEEKTAHQMELDEIEPIFDDLKC